MKKKNNNLFLFSALFFLLVIALYIVGARVTKLEDKIDAMVNEHNKTKEELNELVGKQKEAGEYTYTALVETVQYLEDVISVYDDNVFKYNQNWEDQWKFNNAIIDYLK